MFACIPENNFNFSGLLSEIFVLNFDIPLSWVGVVSIWVIAPVKVVSSYASKTIFAESQIEIFTISLWETCVFISIVFGSTIEILFWESGVSLSPGLISFFVIIPSNGACI